MDEAATAWDKFLRTSRRVNGALVLRAFPHLGAECFNVARDEIGRHGKKDRAQHPRRNADDEVSAINPAIKGASAAPPTK